jgi:hypothetical protein
VKGGILQGSRCSKVSGSIMSTFSFFYPAEFHDMCDGLTPHTLSLA